MKTVMIEHAKSLGIVTIVRPERRNALDQATMRSLADAMHSLGSDTAVQAILLRGQGEQAFCAGADLKEAEEMRQAGRSYPHPMTGLERNLFELILETPKPTIAAINGSAVGAGCEIALACDVRIAAEHAQLGLPEAKRGMGANFASVVLPRLVARSHAFDMLYTGRLISAAEALAIGLVSQVYPSATFTHEAGSYAAVIGGNAPLTLARYKMMALRGWDIPVHAALRLDVGPNPYASADREEGVRAFLEKRAPAWRGE